MGFTRHSGSPRELKSVSLRTNEEFVRLYNDVTEASQINMQRARALDDDQGLGLFGLGQYAGFTDQGWKGFQSQIWDVDQRMKRVEKNALFSEVLAGIMLQFEQNIFPVLRELRLCYEEQIYHVINIRAILFMLGLRLLLRDLFDVFAESISSGLESAYKVMVPALDLLSFVYQYLIGCVDKGGSKTYSPGSFLFRLIFVAIVLFLGSYVWIKFRQASFTANRRKRKSCPLADRAPQLGDESDVPGGVYRRAVKDASGAVTHYKYEPRFKPRREKLESGTSLEFNCLSLGSYNTRREAEIVRHIAVVLYGKEGGRPVQFEDGLCLPFPSVTEPENCPPSGKEKAAWVTHKTKDLYAELLREKARRLQPLHSAAETGSHHGHDGETHRSDPCPSPPVSHSTAFELTCFTPRHGGSGVVEQATTSECHGLGQEPPIAPGVFSASVSDSDIDQVTSSMPQWEENDLPAMDDLDKVVGDNSEIDRGFGFESTLVPPQLSAVDIPTSAIVASLPQLGGGDRNPLEILAPHLNSATAITFQQLESLPEQVQLQKPLTCQEKRPEVFAGSNVELQQKLLEYEGEISVLQQKLRQSEERKSEVEQKLRQSEVEKEKWRSIYRQGRSMVRQIAKLISASDEDGSPGDIQ